MPLSELGQIRRRLIELRRSTNTDAAAVEARDALIDAVLERAEFMDQVLDTIPYAIAVRDPDGRYLVANAAMPENAGLDIPAEEFLGKTFTDVQPDGGASAHIKAFEQVLDAGKPIKDLQFESAVTPGRWRKMSAIPLRDARGRISSVLSVGRDVTARVRDEVVVRENEVKFRELAELSPDAMIVQVGGAICYANESARKILGADSTRSLIGRDSLSIVDPTWRDFVLQRRQQAERRGTRVPYLETRHMRLDGSTFPSEMVAGPIIWDGERGTVNIIHDITSRTEAQVAARDRESRMTNLMRNLPGIAYRLRFDVDASGERVSNQIDFVSDACLDLLGYEPAQLTGKRDLAQFIHPDDHEASQRDSVQKHRAGQQVEARVRILCSDGSWRWMLQRSQRTAIDGDTFTVEGLLVDIDAQVKTEEALAERTRLLQTVIDTVPAASITMRDRAGRLVLANRDAARFFHLDQNSTEFIGKRAEEVGEYGSATIGSAVHEEIINTGEPIVGREYQSPREPGTWRLMNAAPVCAADGSPNAVVQVSIDITERKLAERALLRDRDALEKMVAERTGELSLEIAERIRAEQALARNERLAAIGQVAATVSHELRNPLGTINSSLHLLDRNMPEPSEHWLRARERIQRSIERCVRIIEEMLAYARVWELRRDTVDVDAWLEELTEDANVPADVELSVTANSRVVASIDSGRLGQAVLNVIQNAWQATQQGTAPPTGRKVTVSTSAEGEELLIRVADNGPGIADGDAGRIFEPLFSTKAFGVGLGLPLVKRLVEEHGGRVEVDTSDRGTTFCLRIPVHQS